MSKYKLQQNKAFAPGKIMLVGEWSVLEQGHPCVVMATEKNSLFSEKSIPLGVTVTASDDKKFPSDGEQKSLFVEKALVVAQQYCAEYGCAIRNVSLAIDSNISFVSVANGLQVKCGLGSSAAVVVATIKALFSLYGIREEREIIFKLSSIAHYLAQGKMGSGFDVAAATYGGVLVYERCDSVWLGLGIDAIFSNCRWNHSTKNLCLKNLLAQKWPGLRIEQITLPGEVCIGVGFVGYGAATTALIEKMNKYKMLEAVLYKKICAKIASVVGAFIAACKENDSMKLMRAVRENRLLLQELSTMSGVVLETSELKTLCGVAEQYGGSAKLSGSGGGDCGIVVCPNEQTTKKIMLEWQQKGIVPIFLQRSKRNQ